MSLRTYDTNEPAHNKTFNKTFAISEDLDQPAHPQVHVRVLCASAGACACAVRIRRCMCVCYAHPQVHVRVLLCAGSFVS